MPKFGTDKPLPADFDKETAKIKAELDKVESLIDRRTRGKDTFLRGRNPGSPALGGSLLERRRNLTKRLEMRREAVERATKKRLAGRRR